MVKGTLKHSMPSPLWSALSHGYRQLHQMSRRAQGIPKSLEWRASHQGRESVRRLRQYYDHHRGERCFIFGNGPSLGQMDLAPLVGEVTFGLNRVYLLFDKVGFATTYFVAVNPYVIQQCAPEILETPAPKFIHWDSRRHIQMPADLAFIRPDHPKPGFSTDITRPFWGGATVTFTAMQIAYYMGFKQVILVGVDHRFETQGKPGAVVTLPGSDPNHFDSRYFANGFRWQLPNLPTSEAAYAMARMAFEQAGREILDATVGGALQMFPKISYEKVVEALRDDTGKVKSPLSLQ